MQTAFGSIKSNIERMERIARDLNRLVASYPAARPEERAIIEKSVSVLLDQLILINQPIEALVQSITVEMVRAEEMPKEKIEKEARKAGFERVATATGPVYVSKENKARFLQDLGIEEKELKKIKKRISEKEERPVAEEIMVKPSFLAALSNKIFYNISSNLSKKGLFKSIEKDLRRANMPYTLSSYVSMLLFLTLFTFIVTFILALALSTSIEAALRNVGIAIVLTMAIFLLTLNWPASTASGNRRKIDAELPFATSHMAAIASSKVEPSKIFSIVAFTKEYKAFSAEMRKIVNQINVYGYDLTTALKNVARQTPSRKLAELLNGMSTTITTGGNLTTYLNEKAKSILTEYRLSHERYSTIIGMYSDIYTAILIAAPLIFMLLLAIMSIIGTSFIGMPAESLANFGIGIIAVLNILFLIFLQITQPEI
ncbi:MAG: type II secretion system F family protein [Candidatus Pacearchaeota archaeon]|nr:type II secretion system F family protein [Candidatus Pacearchaeota archaeon]